MFLDKNGKPIVQAFLDRLLNQPLEKQWHQEPPVTKEALIPRDVLLSLISQAEAIFRAEENVVPVDAPMTVVGDIHGQFLDLLYLFELSGPLIQAADNEEDGVFSSLNEPLSPTSEENVRGFDQASLPPTPEHESLPSTPQEEYSSFPTTSASSELHRFQSEPHGLGQRRRKPGTRVLRKPSYEQLPYTVSRRASQRFVPGKQLRKANSEGALSLVKIPLKSSKTEAVTESSNTTAPSVSNQTTLAEEEKAEIRYVFMGDYVDRGSFGCECIIYLLALKVTFPEKIVMIRGNHETRAMTTRRFNEGVGFEQECVAKYGEDIYNAFMNCFDCLPLAALLRTNHGEHLCVHGGIGSKIHTMEDILKIDRVCEPPLKGAMCDLLWADPVDEKIAEKWGDADYEEFLEIDFLPNPARGCSCYFCYAALDEFLNKNQLVGLFRAHECKEEGISFHFAKTRKKTFSFPLVTTVFSAPNYCGTFNNKAGAVRVTNDDMEILRYGAAVDNPLVKVPEDSELQSSEKLSKNELSADAEQTLRSASAPVPSTALKSQENRKVSLQRFSSGVDLSSTNSEKFKQAVLNDQKSELHPGWQSLRRMHKIVGVINKCTRSVSLAGMTPKWRSTVQAMDRQSQERTPLVEESVGEGSEGQRLRSSHVSRVDPLVESASRDAVLRADCRFAMSGTTIDEVFDGEETAEQEEAVSNNGGVDEENVPASRHEENKLSEGPGGRERGQDEVPRDHQKQRRNSAVLSGNVEKEDKDQFRVLFRSIDRNNDGTISADELNDFAASIGCDSEKAASIYFMMDKDKDGKITYEEFIEYAGQLLSSPGVESAEDILPARLSDASSISDVKQYWQTWHLMQDRSSRTRASTWVV